MTAALPAPIPGATLGLVNLRAPARLRHSAVVTPAVPAVGELGPTLLRAPLAVLGCVMIASGVPSVAVAAFAGFAAWDYLDGVLARRIHAETPRRRCADVVIDRLSIHAAIATCALVGTIPWVMLTLFILRDITQALVSLWLLRTHRLVFVAPRWHMSYGLAALSWGSSVICGLSSSPALGVIALVVSAGTLIDYFRLTSAYVANQTGLTQEVRIG